MINFYLTTQCHISKDGEVKVFFTK